MCGISGEIRNRLDGEPDKYVFQKMDLVLAHRGPDGSGFWLDRGVLLAHRRLSIIDLSEASAQPFVLREPKVTITYNGEIYNYVELRDELRKLGHSFTSSGDTEVLLRGYLQWGADVLQRLNGMFAFAIYDGRDESVFAARDAAGQKPFLYFLDSEGLVFASELSALLEHPRCPRNIGADQLVRYLAFDHSPAPETILSGVSRLAPGSFMTYRPRRHEVSVTRYSARRFAETESRLGPEESDFDRLDAILERSVARHLRSDVPVGVYLSGGIDSTLVTLYGARVLGGEKLNTFSIRIDDPTYDEADLAKDTALRLKTNHQEKLLTAVDFVESVPRLLKKLDEPLADLGFLAIAQVAQMAAGQVKVVLSGDGGDEFFYGYEPFMKWRLAKALDHVPSVLVDGVLRPAICALPAQYGYMGLSYKALTFLRAFQKEPALKNISWSGGFLPMEIAGIVNRDFADSFLQKNSSGFEEVYRPLIDIHREALGAGELDRLGSEYQNSYLPGQICAHTDKANMIYSLEARSPLLDNELRAYANAIPSSWKVRDGKGKWILRQLLSKNLPGSPIPFAKKRGFTIPVARWLRQELKPWAADILLTERLGGEFNRTEVRRLWEDHQSGRANNYKKIWPLLVFHVWREQWLS